MIVSAATPMKAACIKLTKQPIRFSNLKMMLLLHCSLLASLMKIMENTIANFTISMNFRCTREWRCKAFPLIGGRSYRIRETDGRLRVNGQSLLMIFARDQQLSCSMRWRKAKQFAYNSWCELWALLQLQKVHTYSFIYSENCASGVRPKQQRCPSELSS